LQDGENSAVPHWSPENDEEIKSGDVILIDMGCKYNGYASDMSRTVFVDNVNQEIKEDYELVLSNQKVAINEIKDGAQIKIISRIVERKSKNERIRCNACTSDMESGLDVHENPVISQKNEKTLKENMVIAIEPRNI